MAVYAGYRPIIKGKNSNDAVHFWKNKKGEYSNYDLFNTSHVFDDSFAHHVPGEGRHPHGLQMTRRFRGIDTTAPMDAAGSGSRLSYHRTHPQLFKGLDTAKALANAGHAPRRFAFTFSRNNTVDFFSGVPSANPLLNGGHAARKIGAAGTANTFGRFNPVQPVGQATAPLAGADGGVPAAGVGQRVNYGFEHVNEWVGVPSAKAL